MRVTMEIINYQLCKLAAAEVPSKFRKLNSFTV